jgi:hypothetical protein
LSQFVPVGKVPYNQLVELLVPFLGDIQSDLMIIGNKVQLYSSDPPFILAINKSEKRIGVIEIIAPSKLFPGDILAHAAWVEKNGPAIANLNRNEFNADLPPFILGLTPTYPEWLEVMSYIKCDIRIYKYSAMTYQGSPVVIFDSLYDMNPASSETVTTPFPQSIQSSNRERPEPGPPVFHDEGIYDERVTELTEEEIRYFSN